MTPGMRGRQARDGADVVSCPHQVHDLYTSTTVMNGHQDFSAGPSVHTRLPRVEEEDESGAESEYSDAAGYAYDEDDDFDEGDSVPEPVYNDVSPDRKGKGVRIDPRRADAPNRSPDVSAATKAKESRSWSDLEWSMIIALVSPVGNWLTGSDHVKNLFLLLLLIFYLHQLVEGQ